MQDTKNMDGRINDAPPNPRTKSIPGLSNMDDVSKKDAMKRGTLQIIKSWSFLTNGKAKRNIPIGIIKY